MKITTQESPPLVQSFSENLLSTHCPKLTQDEEDLYRLYQHIKFYLQKKITALTKRDADFLRYERKFLDLYEQIKKEKNKEEKTRNAAEGPFYWHSVTGERNRKIFERLMHRVRSISSMRKNTEISKV